LALSFHLGSMTAHAQSGRTGSETFERMTTRQLAVVDERGQERAILSMLGGSPSLRLNDGAGTLRAFVAVKPDGSPLITLGDAKGTVRAALQVTGGASFLTLADTAGKARAQVAVARDWPVVSLMDEAGALRASLG